MWVKCCTILSDLLCLTYTTYNKSQILEIRININYLYNNFTPRKKYSKEYWGKNVLDSSIVRSIHMFNKDLLSFW